MKRKFEPASESRTVDGCDDGHTELAETKENALALIGEFARSLDIAEAGHEVQICSSAECSIAACDDNTGHVSCRNVLSDRCDGGIEAVQTSWTEDGWLSFGSRNKSDDRNP
jgi:hypothetical protein